MQIYAKTTSADCRLFNRATDLSDRPAKRFYLQLNCLIERAFTNREIILKVAKLSR